MQITGVCYVKANGSLWRSKSGAKLMMGGMERTAQFANGVFVGQSEAPVAASVEATLLDAADTDLRELSDLTNATIEFETDTGNVYMISDAGTKAPCELTGGEGEVSISVEGKAAVKV